MLFHRTEHYYKTVTGYRAKLRAIWSEYDAEMQKIEQYAGSEGYAREKRDIEKKRDADIKALQSETGRQFDAILDGMRASAGKRTFTPPTQDQLAIVEALRMRDKVSRDELDMAANTLKDCPLLMPVLQEISDNMLKKYKEHEYLGYRVDTTSTAAIMRNIDELQEAAKRICKLNKCDSRAEMVERHNIHSPKWESDAFYSAGVDRDVNTPEDCMSLYGGVSADNYSEFEEITGN